MTDLGALDVAAETVEHKFCAPAGAVVQESEEPLLAGVSWAAVVAGAAASCALVMLSFGAGVGFSVVSPWAHSGVSATSFEIGTGLYFIVMR
jgi:hypothetical protein